MSFFSKLGKELDSMFDGDKKDKKDKEGKEEKEHKEHKEEKPPKVDESSYETTRGKFSTSTSLDVLLQN